MEFLRYFWEQKITPKKQSWSPRHVEKMMHYTSQKIAPFQALISSKLHSVQSWHLFCQPKTVSFTNPQVHGPPNPLLYRELDCIQIVIWPAQAILDLFTDLHPLRKPDFFILPENMQNKAKEIPSLVLGTKMEKVFCRVSYGPSTLAMHIVHNCMFWPCTGIPANISTSQPARYERL